MKKQFYILACALITISLQSCVDSIPIPNEEVDAKLVFESDISDTKGFSARITTSTGFDDIDAIGHPEDITVKIRKANQDAAFELFYEKDCNCYTNSVELPSPGLPYKLEAFKEDSEIFEPIQSNMSVPSRTILSEMEAIKEVEDDGSTLIESEISLKKVSTTGNFFHVIPFRKETILVENTDGEEEEVFTGRIDYLDLETYNNHNLYLEQNHNGPGFFVDFQGEDVGSNALNILLHTEEVIDYENEAFTRVYFEVRSVTESYYYYERYLSNKLDSQQDGIVEAPISYSNIVNGLGYFGGYTTSMDSVLVQ